MQEQGSFITSASKKITNVRDKALELENELLNNIINSKIVPTPLQQVAKARKETEAKRAEIVNEAMNSEPSEEVSKVQNITTLIPAAINGFSNIKTQAKLDTEDLVKNGTETVPAYIENAWKLLPGEIQETQASGTQEGFNDYVRLIISDIRNKWKLDEKTLKAVEATLNKEINGQSNNQEIKNPLQTHSKVSPANKPEIQVNSNNETLFPNTIIDTTGDENLGTITTGLTDEGIKDSLINNNTPEQNKFTLNPEKEPGFFFENDI